MENPPVGSNSEDNEFGGHPMLMLDLHYVELMLSRQKDRGEGCVVQELFITLLL